MKQPQSLWCWRLGIPRSRLLNNSVFRNRCLTWEWSTCLQALPFSSPSQWTLRPGHFRHRWLDPGPSFSQSGFGLDRCAQFKTRTTYVFQKKWTSSMLGNLSLHPQEAVKNWVNWWGGFESCMPVFWGSSLLLVNGRSWAPVGLGWPGGVWPCPGLVTNSILFCWLFQNQGSV